MSNRIELVEKFRTRDGREFSFRAMAEDHADALDRADKANEALTGGHPLSSVYEIASGDKNPHPVLARATGATGIVIEHWQCSRFPCYSVYRVVVGKGVDVAGTGGWSGVYGNLVSWRDLARYLETTEATSHGLGPVIDDPAYAAHRQRMSQ